MAQRALARLILACIAFAPSLGVASDAAEVPWVYEIPAKGPAQLAALEARGIEVLARTARGTLHVNATPAQAAVLVQLAGRAEVLATADSGPHIADLDANLGAYRTYTEATAVLQALVAAHPTLASLSSIGQSLEGRSILALKISDNVGADESEPEVLLMGCHHARELMSVEIPLQFAEYLLNQYGSNMQVTQLVQEREIWIVPIVNPDGYVYVQNNHAGASTNWWRKNRRDNGDGSFGVDPNRNYGYLWGYDNIGSSPTKSSATYRGTAAFSEPEIQALRDFCNNHEFVMWLSYHSYGELLLYPWGYAFDYTTDHELYQRLGAELAAGTGYLVGNAATGAIYRTNGGSDDWAYADIASRPAIYGFTPEVGSFADGAFGPAESFIAPYFALLLPMNLKCLELAGNPQQVLGPARPVITSVQGTAAEELILTWTGNVPADPNQAASYELRGWQLLGDVTLDAEAASPWVALAGGFVPSTSRAAAGSGSYYSGMADNLSATATFAAPYRVTPATQTLTCRLWYDIENDYDYAYVEVSENQGLTWQPVGGSVTTNANPNGSNRGNGITGQSGGWVAASFALADFLGQEILLRLHYVTDGGVLNEGLYVDLLHPVLAFGIQGSIASGILGTSHRFTPEATGSWLYQVRGLDADSDWSRWSPGFEVQVDDPIDAQLVPPAWTSLDRNVPNPFNPFTMLVFTVGAPPGGMTARPVELTIHTATGERVATLVRAALPPGQHRAPWNGTSSGGVALPSGTYFARLQVDGEPLQSRKLLLLR